MENGTAVGLLIGGAVLLVAATRAKQQQMSRQPGLVLTPNGAQFTLPFGGSNSPFSFGNQNNGGGWSNIFGNGQGAGASPWRSSPSAFQNYGSPAFGGPGYGSPAAFGGPTTAGGSGTSLTGTGSPAQQGATTYAA